jgi:membrane protein implicated in regulation of membrane protease activity
MSFLQQDSPEGRQAHVTVAIPGGDRPGEVVLRIRGGTESYIAYADVPIDIGSEVVVVADRGARTLFVVPF